MIRTKCKAAMLMNRIAFVIAKMLPETNYYTCSRSGQITIYYCLPAPLARHIHIKCWFSGRVTLTRHCTYSQSQKYIICVCITTCTLLPCRLNISFACCSDIRLFRRLHLKRAYTKGRSSSTWLLSFVSYRLIALILSKTHKVYI